VVYVIILPSIGFDRQQSISATKIFSLQRCSRPHPKHGPALIAVNQPGLL